MLVLVLILTTGCLGFIFGDEPAEQPTPNPDLLADQQGQSVQPDLFGEAETSRPTPTVSNSTCNCGENNASLHQLEKANIMQVGTEKLAGKVGEQDRLGRRTWKVGTENKAGRNGEQDRLGRRTWQ